MIAGNSDPENKLRIDIEKVMPILNSLEEAISGKPSKWATGNNNQVTSVLALTISILSSFWMVSNEYGSMADEIELKHVLFLLAFGATSFLLAWTFLLTLV